MKTPPAPVCTACAMRLHDRCIGCLCDHDDPMVMAAQSLALTMAHFRAMISDDRVYAENALPAFERLAAMLPVPVAVPAPAGRNGR